MNKNKKYKIEELLKVNKDEKIGKQLSVIKEFLESKELLTRLTTQTLKIEKFIVETQGSYSRHTASYILDDEKSDIDIIVYIGNYLTSNNTQVQNSTIQLYKSFLVKSIRNILEFDGSYLDDIVPLNEFVSLKQRLFNELKSKFNTYKITNNNKCITIEIQKNNFDICIAGKWYLETNSKSYNDGANIIINNYPFEIQTQPKLNKDNLEKKAINCPNLYNYIRIFKNINKLLQVNLISSYVIECLIFNLNNKCFKSYPNIANIKLLLTNISNYFSHVKNNNGELVEINGILIFDSKISNDIFYRWKKIFLNFVENNIEE